MSELTFDIADIAAVLRGRLEGFVPDISADIYEKWVGFLALAISGLGLALLTGIIAYFIAGAALRPLRDLGAGLTRIQHGDYGTMVVPAGPPEIRRSCEGVNELARTLDRLSRDNRGLLRKIVSLQDDDRTEPQLGLPI